MAQDSWLLTKKEIKNLITGDQWNHATIGEENLKILALAQDAKTKQHLMAWIVSIGEYSPDFPVNTFKVPQEEWKALYEELRQ